VYTGVYSMGMNDTTTIGELEQAIATMKANGGARSAPGRFKLLKERLAKMKHNVSADAKHQEKMDEADAPHGRCDTCGAECDRNGCTADQSHEISNPVAAGQREWQRKFESGEFTAEADVSRTPPPRCWTH
jgi:hypothetical protein